MSRYKTIPVKHVRGTDSKFAASVRGDVEVGDVVIRNDGKVFLVESVWDSGETYWDFDPEYMVVARFKGAERLPQIEWSDFSE